MSKPILIRLLESIGQIEDFFLEEAAVADIAQTKSAKRKRIAKYGAYGAAGALAGVAVSFGVAATLLRLKSNRVAKSA